MSGVVFREEDHTYWKGNTRLPSVTEILRPMVDFRFVRDDVLQWKSDLGSAVHRAIELHLLDDLEYDSLVGDVAQYFDQFLIFEKEAKFRSLGTELIVSHALGFAGKVDCIGLFGGNKAPAEAIVDWKTTAQISPVVALQTAAYALAADVDGSHDFAVCGRRYALRLSPNNYRLHRFAADTYNYDLHVFKSLLTLHKWCEKHNKPMEIPENVG